MNEVFELTQEERDRIEADTHLHIAGLYQQMLNGDRNAEQRLAKICDGALVYHRYNCLSPIDEVYAKHDLNFVAGRYDGWILEAVDNQKTSQEFEQNWTIDNGGRLEYMTAGDRKEVEAHLAMLDRDDQVGSYIDEALAFDEGDLDHGEDLTAASVCRM